MQFYFKKPHQDRLYLKIITTINLSYWKASDAHHYASEHTNEVNKYEYDRLKSQYNLAINLFTEGQDLIHFLEGDHEIIKKILSDIFEEEHVCVELGGVPETTALLKERWDYIFFA